MSNWCREKNCYCNNTTDFGYCKTTVCIKSEKTSTVEAIPIEWIKEWAMKNWVKTGKCEFDIIVSKLIDEWLEERCREKENETN